MPNRPRPRVHARDHEHGGADPTLIHYDDVGDSGAGGGGIMFDTSPQAGGFLQVTTTSGAMNFEQTAPDADLNLFSESTAVNVDGQGVFITGEGDGGVIIAAHGLGDLVIDDTTTDGSWIVIRVSAASDNQLRIVGLPTSNPGGTGLVWNDGGTLKIT